MNNDRSWTEIIVDSLILWVILWPFLGTLLEMLDD